MRTPTWLNELFTVEPESNNFKNMDFLRIYASIGVFVHHSVEFLISPGKRQQFSSDHHGLALFVDLFFCISGYIIANFYAHKVGTARQCIDFATKRAARLLPLHLLTLFVSIAIWSALLQLGAKANSAPSFEVSCIAKTVFLLHAASPCAAFNGVNWSISAEMFMYALFPLIALATHKTNAIAPAIVAISILIFLGQRTSSEWTTLNPIVRAAPSFIIGSAMFQLKGHINRINIPAIAPIAFLILATLAMFFNAPAQLTLIAIYLTVTAASACDARRRSSALVTRTYKFSTLTYSIYLIHTIIILCVVNIIGDKMFHLSAAPMLALITVAFAITLVASAISYNAFERPTRTALTRALALKPLTV